MGILSLFLKSTQKETFNEDISIGERVIVYDLLSNLWNKYLGLPDRVQPGTITAVYGHGVYDVQLDAPDTPVFGVRREDIGKLTVPCATPAVVEKFIEDFKCYDIKGEVSTTFLCGYCYYFSVILKERFPGTVIMYDEVGNHFVALINDRLYDITGDITSSKADFIPWSSLRDRDSLLYNRIVRDCICKL